MNSQKLIPLQLATPIGSLDAYIAMANRIPMLTPEEEQECAHNFREHNNLEAAKRLVLAHLRYVVKIARGYDGYGLAQADLIQEGNIGLMKAVKRFDPTLGVRLVSFAVHWIKAEIHDFILRNWRIVKVATTKAQRKLFFNLRKAKKGLHWLTDAEVKTVADDLKVPQQEVREMEMRLQANDADIHYQMDDDDSASPFPQHYLADANANPALLLEHEDTSERAIDGLQKALQQLDARSQTIIHKRWLQQDKATLEDLSKEFSISCERVRQLEKAAMQKLAKWLGVVAA